MKRDYYLYLDDMVEAIEKIGEYTQDMEYDFFRKDQKTIDAVIRNFEIIGEAVKHIPSALKKKHPDIPWREMAGMRNKLIHEYFGIRHDIVWKTIQERLPELLSSIKKLIEIYGAKLLIKK